ncbi:DNA-binding XRE family transcriptional regulator [Dyadobacter jejuensis]|uniref:DNA-binding XRE family transcriptional regulator n=2 Tax=Dyadobacter jejuensis TaxID=1082580 RepID=A0A316ARB8_9BACT|nr:DNA-binding XRE family transcriptional regulator [Dyadobacter jejuensis]
MVYLDIISIIYPMNKEEIAHYITTRRQLLALNQEDVAAMAGITAKTIYMIESGKGNPSLETLQKLLTVLGLTIQLKIKSIPE